jgi:hypothetical protein
MRLKSGKAADSFWRANEIAARSVIAVQSVMLLTAPMWCEDREADRSCAVGKVLIVLHHVADSELPEFESA